MHIAKSGKNGIAFFVHVKAHDDYLSDLSGSSLKMFLSQILNHNERCFVNTEGPVFCALLHVFVLTMRSSKLRRISKISFDVFDAVLYNDLVTDTYSRILPAERKRIR